MRWNSTVNGSSQSTREQFGLKSHQRIADIIRGFLKHRKLGNHLGKLSARISVLRS
jgi:hypothetical protein